MRAFVLHASVAQATVVSSRFVMGGFQKIMRPMDLAGAQENHFQILLMSAVLKGNISLRRQVALERVSLDTTHSVPRGFLYNCSGGAALSS